MWCSFLHLRLQGKWLNHEKAQQLYEEVWQILDEAMDKSEHEKASLPDTAKMMDFFRRKVQDRRSETDDPGAYGTLMMEIVEM